MWFDGDPIALLVTFAFQVYFAPKERLSQTCRAKDRLAQMSEITAAGGSTILSSRVRACGIACRVSTVDSIHTAPLLWTDVP